MLVVEYQSVLASDTSIHLAGQQGHSHRLGHPPTLEQLGLGKCIVFEAFSKAERLKRWWVPKSMGMTLLSCEVLASDTSIHLAGQQGHSHRLGHPPTLEQLGLGKCLEHDARRAVDGPRDNHLAVRLPFHRGAVLHGAGLTFDSCVHCSSPFVSVPRQPCPTRRSVRPSACGTSPAPPPLPPIRACPAGSSARARSSSW